MRVFAGLLLVAFSSCADCAEFLGRVVGVADGDTLTVLADNHNRMKVRLAGIDAPERAQDFGSVSKKHLSDKVFGQIVTANGQRWTSTVA